MKTIIFATLLTLLSTTAYAEVKVTKDDSIYLTSSKVVVKSPSGKSVSIMHDCDLKVNPYSKPIVKNNGRKVNKNSVLTIIVDGDINLCRVKNIAIV
jgi:hypothetical protein